MSHSAGSPPETNETDLVIGGMTCASCAARIEKKLNRLDGVTASVNYATEKAQVPYTDTVSTDTISTDTVGTVSSRCSRVPIHSCVRARHSPRVIATR